MLRESSTVTQVHCYIRPTIHLSCATVVQCHISPMKNYSSMPHQFNVTPVQCSISQKLHHFFNAAPLQCHSSPMQYYCSSVPHQYNATSIQCYISLMLLYSVQCTSVLCNTCSILHQPNATSVQRYTNQCNAILVQCYSISVLTRYVNVISFYRYISPMLHQYNATYFCPMLYQPSATSDQCNVLQSDITENRTEKHRNSGRKREGGPCYCCT